ncbi:hypothetical protein Stube_41050 [Streptomyces tubercidicus]|uniref:Uncharacterized protein n=1 Tax=Streptomyces tubercidicus TaxID=47759 RepID=A0A640UVP7_9ACTN|nr:hypothetical protein Stube_41050 [Streptomyces tubercidicus]
MRGWWGPARVRWLGWSVTEVTGAALAVPYGRVGWRTRDRSGPGIPYSRSTQDKAPDRAGKQRR